VNLSTNAESLLVDSRHSKVIDSRASEISTTSGIAVSFRFLTNKGVFSGLIRRMSEFS